MKLSSNWYGHPSSNVNKQMHIFIGGVNHVFTLAQGAGTGTLRAEIWLQGIANLGSEVNLAPNLGQPATLVRGQWQRWEIVMKANSAGTPDGTIDWWLDGVKVGSYTGIQFTSGASRWEVLQWSPTWGGIGSTVPADQFESLDHIYISGKN
jgi:hypothetical protein